MLKNADYASSPFLASGDLALVDTLRAGGVRDRKVATGALRAELGLVV
ncbi:MAG: hypothetical protein FJZ00_08955 [Candidatus Sericytochromatia bacterium]|uniref:Uncharacterized protein n=1 Tax=Candidatus Tanganyikabacteria bacterium TaxID=2961651 RepID=A0A938BNL7_9BACT|nr:hypothetical protein [Candidatus Tanganyikabacteria bacterium]